ncbi:MAG: diguanylate cyclase [Chromatiales bacterium]|nr:diguanylate cyclase [Chromatiales bacterium]
MLNILKTHISSAMDLETVCATTLTECKAKLKQVGRDNILCAVLDLTLPDAPNGEIVPYIQEAGIPVIILTASVERAIELTMSGDPIIEYVVKRGVEEIDHVRSLVEKVYKNQFSKVLIVGDSPSYVKYLSSLLDYHRYEVLSINNGHDALKMLEKNPDIHLVITDYNLPKMNGLELIKHIRDKYRREEMAVLGLSSSKDTNLTVKLLKTGANDYMSKPFMPDEFYCRVNQCVSAISHLRTVKENAGRDFLTKVHNRSSLFEIGHNMHANALRGNYKLAVAMIDADHFKQVNDTHGHDAGDAVLVSMAKMLKQTMRSSDVVARFGGEEFICIAAIKNDADAGTVFEKVRTNIEAMSVETQETRLNITVSIGVTTSLCGSLDEMIKVADEAVYQSKRQGRNRVTIL